MAQVENLFNNSQKQNFQREKTMVSKAVILVGGPGKGTRFRPLSLDIPKPLFPIAGLPLVQHHIESCASIETIKEILLIGFFQPTEQLNRFIREMKDEYKLNIRYLQEYSLLGTAGSIYLFRDLILTSGTEAFFLIFCDIFCDLRGILSNMIAFREKWMKYLVMGVQVENEQSMNYGCMGVNPQTNEVVHYIEKPSSFVSNHINGGVYLLSTEVFDDISKIFQERVGTGNDSISLESDILSKQAGQGKVFAFMNEKFWMSIKSAGSAVYASRIMMEMYKKYHPNRLSTDSNCEGNVYIHPSAKVHPSAKLGPHVSIGSNVVVEEGARVKNSIILDGVIIKKHGCVLNSIVGWHSTVGSWTRVEGTPTQLHPDRPHATTDNFYLFDDNGKLLPTITILGRDTITPDETIIRNAIILPGKELHGMKLGLQNQILL